MREFFSLDNPKNAETNDDDDQPGADESDSQVTNKWYCYIAGIFLATVHPFIG